MGPTIVRTIAAASPSRKAAHRIIACLCVGVADGIEGGVLSPRDAVKDLFTDENYQEVKRHRMNKALKACFEAGMRLDSPGGQASTVAQMKELARQALKASR